MARRIVLWLWPVRASGERIEPLGSRPWLLCKIEQTIARSFSTTNPTFWTRPFGFVRSIMAARRHSRYLEEEALRDAAHRKSKRCKR
jgi:hypothetical protein